MHAGAATCDQHVERAVCDALIGRARKPRLNVAVERHGLIVGQHFCPSRIRVFLVLLAHLFGNGIADRGELFDLRPDRLLVARILNLLQDETAHWLGPAMLHKRIDSGDRMKRQVAGQQRDLERLDGFARFRCRDDGVAKFFDLICLVVSDVENIFVDEALLRDGAGDRQPLIGQVVRTLMQFIQQCAPGCRQNSLKRNRGDRRRAQKRMQQPVACDGCQITRTEQVIRPMRPCVGQPRGAACHRRAAQKDGARGMRKIARPAPGLVQGACKKLSEVLLDPDSRGVQRLERHRES